MNGQRPLGIAALTTLALDPPEVVTLAAAVGASSVGLRLAPYERGERCHDLVGSRAAVRRTAAALASTGVGVLDIEVIRIGPDFTVDDLAPLLAVGAELSAQHLLVVSGDDDESRFIDNFAALCDAAAAHGMTAELEFMPYTPIRDLACAHRVVEKAAHPSGGILIDPLHLSRSGGTAEQVAGLPRNRLRYSQICDVAGPPPATRDALIAEARSRRLAPGTGDLKLTALLAALPPDLPLAVEVPNAERTDAIGAQAWVAQAVDATRALLDRAARG